MPSYGETMSGIPPDGTQGIATIELKTGDSVPIAKLLGCVIHVSKKDKSLRNILKVSEEKNNQVKYFIYVPWSRTLEINENTSIVVKLRRYKKIEENEKEFSVNESNSKEIFEKYCNDDYLVIPCPKLRNFQKSSFLKKWSSELLLHNNSSQVSQSGNLHGLKRVKNEKNKTLFKYCGFEEESDKLEEQGVLLIRHSIYESYVIGCYKKENSSTEKYCFLLKGLERITEQEDESNSPPPEQPPSGSVEEGRENRNPEQPPSLGIDEGSENSTSEQPPDLSRGTEEGRDNPTPDQRPSESEERIDLSTLDQPFSTTAQQGQGNQEQLQESEDGRIGSSELVAPRRPPSAPKRNRENESEKTKKRELIHNTYGPRVEGMPYDVMHEVFLRLNPKQRVKGNDYRRVADKIGLDRIHIENLSKENPMEDVFCVMTSRVTKVNEFVDILFQIGRDDVVQKMYEMTLESSGSGGH